MPGPISVIIPTLNAADRLGGCLQALASPSVAEILVVDADSNDATVAVAEAAGARVLHAARPSRGAQLRAGCAAAVGEWLLALHADTRLEPGWAEAARPHMADHPDKAGWFRFALDDSGTVAGLWTAGVNLRSRAGWPYGDQGLLIPRPLYDAVGGYCDLPLMEDVDLVRRIGGARLRPLRARAVTSAVRYTRAGYLGQSLRNWVLLARWMAGADPADLARRYRG